MVPWRPPPPADDRPLADNEEPETEPESDDDLPPQDTPPHQFFQDVRAILPDVDRASIYSAWDRSRGVGGESSLGKEAYNPASLRVQAAMEFLFTQDDGAALDPPPSFPTQQRHRPASRTLFLPDPESDDKHDHVFAQADQVTEELVLDESDEGEGSPPRPWKGKGRAVDIEPAGDDEIQILDFNGAASDFRSRIGKSRAVSTPLRYRIPSPATPPSPPPIKSSADKLTDILLLVPDVDPNYVSELLIAAQGDADAVVDRLFSKGYPKKSPAGKKRTREEVEEEKERDWLKPSSWRGVPSVQYKKQALEQLNIDYDRLPASLIKDEFKKTGFYYAPTYMLFKNGDFSNKHLVKKRVAKKNAGAGEEAVEDKEFEAEKIWLSNILAKEHAEKKRRKEEARQIEMDAKAGLLIECGCCYGEFRFQAMVQCQDAHLFCAECATANAHNVIGQRGFKLACMAEGCEMEFSLASMENLLKPAEVTALLKNKQDREVEEAQIDGLESCPYCPYACVIENEDEKLFRCQRVGCERVSCRSCKKEEHLPLTCEEAQKEKEKDKKISARHAVEEEMTKALVRKCPKCKYDYVKEDGCNHIICANCGQHSCYICGKMTDMKGGYSHWMDYTPGSARSSSSKCPTFDDTEVRNFKAVEAARVAALERLRADQEVELEDDDVNKIKLKEPQRGPPRGPLQPRALAGPGYGFGGMFGAENDEGWDAGLAAVYDGQGGGGGGAGAGAGRWGGLNNLGFGGMLQWGGGLPPGFGGGGAGPIVGFGGNARPPRRNVRAAAAAAAEARRGRGG